MRRASPLARLFAITGAILFLASLLFLVYCYGRRYGEIVVAGAGGPWWPAVAFDAALFSAFALHHSIFARMGVKAWIARLVSPALERSTYIWIASVLFIATCSLWRAVPGIAWTVGGPLRLAMHGLQLMGIVITLGAVRRLDVLDLAGVRQLTVSAAPAPVVVRTGLYAWVRHPIYFGWFLMVWPTPLMTGTRLTFAAISSIYLIVAVPLEERDLRRTFGDAYAEYAEHVRWRLVPFLW